MKKPLKIKLYNLREIPDVSQLVLKDGQLRSRNGNRRVKIPMPNGTGVVVVSHETLMKFRAELYYLRDQVQQMRFASELALSA